MPDNMWKSLRSCGVDCWWVTALLQALLLELLLPVFDRLGDEAETL